ncbi:unnamed protein product [Cylicostephanus goldi]|uniref:ABC transmembrane type-1 domain-containing protein n=1 Tax=Cylicostephanus goldi TaxID=71465 RepID=A0A3P6R143_CYLGO|nr:unnamed protein product [Cylicostephanus goldi]
MGDGRIKHRAPNNSGAQSFQSISIEKRLAQLRLIHSKKSYELLFFQHGTDWEGFLMGKRFQATCFAIVCENLVNQLRREFFKAILRQDIVWYDKNNSGNLTPKFFDNLERVKEGTGDKLGLLIQFVAQFFGGFIVAFTYDWKLTLIMMSLSPFTIVSGAFISKLMASAATEEAKKYAVAGGIAEEVLTSIRTVIAFNGQPYECERLV